MPSQTKEQRAEYMKAWRIKNINREKVRDKEYYEKNKDRLRIYRKTNSLAIKDYKLRNKYNISLEEYNEIFTKQGGKCAICGDHQSEIKTALSVDHCHSTGKVRGLLCGNCNRGIGMLKDDIENLRCAILYLDKND